MHTTTHRRVRHRRWLAATVFALITGCRSPASDAYILEQLRQMADELNSSRQQTADLQIQLDSIRVIVARQDTLLTRLAGMAGVPR